MARFGALAAFHLHHDDVLTTDLSQWGAAVIAGNLPFKTEVASLYVFEHINSDDPTGASALAVLMLVISFGVLLGIGAVRHWAVRHDR